MDRAFADVVSKLRLMPGIGPRHATRIVLALLEKPAAELADLGAAIANLKDRVRQCGECFNVSDDGICAVCRDRSRDARQILTVEHVTDLESVQRAGIWRGLYHVLGGAISPMDDVGPEKLRIRELAERVDRFLPQVGALELVIATNPTSTGEMTSTTSATCFTMSPVSRTTRLARGLASGTHLEYADEITLRHALEARK